METNGSWALGSLSFTIVNVGRCGGCGRCVAACPQKIISLEAVGYRKNAVIVRKLRCLRCGRCVENCPLGAFD